MKTKHRPQDDKAAAIRFGGKLEFWSEAGAGTEALLTVPAAAAYANSNGGAFSFLRRKKAGA